MLSMRFYRHAGCPLCLSWLLLILPGPKVLGSQKLHTTICLCSMFAEQAMTACLSHELPWHQELLAGASARKNWDTYSNALDSVPSEDNFLVKGQEASSLTNRTETFVMSCFSTSAMRFLEGLQKLSRKGNIPNRGKSLEPCSHFIYPGGDVQVW